VANFSPIVHTLSLGVDGSGSIQPAAGAYQYNEGDVVTVKAVPNQGWQFDGWRGGVTNPDLTTTTVIVSSSKTVTAEFTPIVHNLSLGVDGSGSTKPVAGTHQYREGDVVTVIAITGEGWRFDGWSGDVTDSKSAVTTVTVSSNKTVTANFSPIVHTISLGVDGSGSVQPAAGPHDYDEGDVVTITAIPGEGWRFDGWSGDVTDSESAVTTVTVSSNKTVTAHFSQAEPSWWKALHTVYDKVLAMFRSLGN